MRSKLSKLKGINTIGGEVAADAFVNSVDDASIDSAAEEIALTTARELALKNLAALGNTSQRMARLKGLPSRNEDICDRIYKRLAQFAKF